MLYVISYALYGKDCTEYLGSSIKYTHSPKDTEQLITYNFAVSPSPRVVLLPAALCLLTSVLRPLSSVSCQLHAACCISLCSRLFQIRNPKFEIRNYLPMLYALFLLSPSSVLCPPSSALCLLTPDS
jgi:hypothetical protein